MPPSNLRERKKERTRATITRIALELFARDGFAATTITDIAEAADVSPRTVSTYFPSKEGIVFAGFEASRHRLSARLAARGPDEPVIDLLGAWLRAEADQEVAPTTAIVRARNDDQPDFARLRQTAIARDADLWALARRQTHAVARQITAAVAEDLGCEPDKLAPRIVAEAAVASFLELNAYAADSDEDMLESLDVALEFVRAGLERLRA